MEILIFTDNPVVKETQLVLEELRDRGITTRLETPWGVCLPEITKFASDLAYVPSNMLNRGSTFELIHRLLILREIELQVGTVINPVNSLLHYSKGQLTMQMHKLGFKHPRTLVTENLEKAWVFADEILDSGGKLVLKPLCKGRGVGVVLLESPRGRDELLQYLNWYNRSHAKGVYYLQEFIPNVGFDVRCLVIDGEVSGRERRFNPEDFRYNVSAGGRAEAFNDPVYDELSIKIAEATGLKITGVDILPTDDGVPYVLEANCFPGYLALIRATGIPIHKKIVDYFQRLLKK